MGEVAADQRDEIARVDLVQHVLDPSVCRWSEDHSIALTGPAAISRQVLKRYRADVFLLDRSPGRKSGLLTDLKVFLDDARLHDWAGGLPANATYFGGEIPSARKWLPRFIDEFLMVNSKRPTRSTGCQSSPRKLRSAF